MTINLPAKSAKFFADLASDAGNWSGTPWLTGNLAPGKGSSAMSQTLVRHGLIEVGSSEDGTFAIFTPAGIAAAAEIGIDLSWLAPKPEAKKPGTRKATKAEKAVEPEAKPVKVCKKDPSHGPHRVTKTGSYCYACDRIVAERQKAERAAAKEAEAAKAAK